MLVLPMYHDCRELGLARSAFEAHGVTDWVDSSVAGGARWIRATFAGEAQAIEVARELGASVWHGGRWAWDPTYYRSAFRPERIG